MKELTLTIQIPEGFSDTDVLDALFGALKTERAFASRPSSRTDLLEAIQDQVEEVYDRALERYRTPKQVELELQPLTEGEKISIQNEAFDIAETYQRENPHVEG